MLDTRGKSVASSSNITTPGTPKSLTVSFSGVFILQQLLEAVPEYGNESIIVQEQEDLVWEGDINPYWAEHSLISKANRDFLTGKELKFWVDFIPKYLKPIRKTKKQVAKQVKHFACTNCRT